MGACSYWVSSRCCWDAWATSLAMMRPPGPVPLTEERSTFASLACTRAKGLAIGRPEVGGDFGEGGADGEGVEDGEGERGFVLE